MTRVDEFPYSFTRASVGPLRFPPKVQYETVYLNFFFPRVVDMRPKKASLRYE